MAGRSIERIGRYLIEAELGRGAMGVVYRARDPRIDRVVAIKTLAVPMGSDAATAKHLRERFLNEGRAAGRLNHPGIVTVFDADEDPDTGTVYLAMEFVEGADLKALLARGFPPSRVIQVLTEVAAALDHAHARGVIHRDVKPANILVTEDGQAKLTDFGIARLAAQNLTMAGQFLGSPAYMSPEQIRGLPVTHSTDLFSLAVVLYEGLTGSKPFEGDDLIATTHAIAHGQPRRASEVKHSISPQIDTVLETALAKEASQRYPNATTLMAAAAAALQGDVAAGQPPKPVVPASPAPAEIPAGERAATGDRHSITSRLPVPLLVAGGSALVLVLVAVVMLVRHAARPELPASPVETTAPVAATSASGPAVVTTKPASKPVTKPSRPASASSAPMQLPPAKPTPSAAATAPETPAAPALAKGRLEVTVSSFYAGTLLVRDGDFVVLRERIAQNRQKGRLKDPKPSALFGIAVGSGMRTLEFTFTPDDRKPLQQRSVHAVPAGGTVKVQVDIGTLGRDLDVSFP